MTNHLALGRGREGRRVFRGWLLFFFATTCVGLATRMAGIVRAVEIAANAAATGMAPPVGATLVALVARVALLAATLNGLHLFARGDARTPTWWGLVLLADVSFGVTLVVAAAYRSTVVDQTPFLTALSWSVRLYGSSSQVVALAWLGYWMRSAQVRRTFGANAFARADGISPPTALRSPE
jgi:hypothetical protein